MARLPLIGRLSPREYAALVLGFLLLVFESIIHVIILLLPLSFISWCRARSRTLFDRTASTPTKPKSNSPEKKISDRILRARDFGELCAVFGYTPEEHVVLTKDGYLLGLHRLPSKQGETRTDPGTSTGKPVVYLHHGLLMNSEIWVCLTSEERCLPFALVEAGFDVWLGGL